MTRARMKFEPEPRIWTQEQVCARLNMSATTFAARLRSWPHFPARINHLGGWDSVAVERWLDQQSGFVETTSGMDARGKFGGL